MTDSAGHTSSELAMYGPLAISSAVSIHGTHALAIPVTVPDANRTLVVVRVPLCLSAQAIDLAGKTMGFNIRFVTAADSPNLFAGGESFALFYPSPTSVILGLRFSAEADVTRGDSPWVTTSGDIVTAFGSSGPATHAGLMLVFQNVWKGTVYIDDFKIF